MAKDYYLQIIWSALRSTVKQWNTSNKWTLVPGPKMQTPIKLLLFAPSIQGTCSFMHMPPGDFTCINCSTAFPFLDFPWVDRREISVPNRAIWPYWKAWPCKSTRHWAKTTASYILYHDCATTRPPKSKIKKTHTRTPHTVWAPGWLPNSIRRIKPTALRKKWCLVILGGRPSSTGRT